MSRCLGVPNPFLAMLFMPIFPNANLPFRRKVGIFRHSWTVVQLFWLGCGIADKPEGACICAFHKDILASAYIPAIKLFWQEKFSHHGKKKTTGGRKRRIHYIFIHRTRARRKRPRRGRIHWPRSDGFGQPWLLDENSGDPARGNLRHLSTASGASARKRNSGKGCSFITCC